MNIRKYIPDSISALVYKMKSKRWLWTLGIWGMVFPALYYMIEHDPSMAPLAFASCVSIVFVGAMPLVKHEKNTLHNVLGVTGAILSLIWVVIEQYPNLKLIVALWLLYILLLSILRDKWCFFAELLCIGTVTYTILGS